MKRENVFMALWIVTLAALSVSLYFLGNGKGNVHTVIRTVKVDTASHANPPAKDSAVIRYETVRLRAKPLRADTVYGTDTVYAGDTVQAVIPIIGKHYGDSTYDAWISGYSPRLDSIRVYSRTVRETEYIKVKSRWGIGLQAGYGMGRSGTVPYIGVGVTYNILSW